MLTDKAVRALAAREKAYKIADNGGLHLKVSPKGHKSWRLKYRQDGKEQLLTLGAYPEVSLADARAKRDDARKILRSGKDPRHAAKRSKLIGENIGALTFEKAARRWHDIQKVKWRPVHAGNVITSLEANIFPDLGQMPMDEIDKPTLLAVLRKMEARGSIETARRVKQRVASVYRFVNAEGRNLANPALDIDDALKPLPPATRHPALLEMSKIRAMLFDIDRAASHPVTRLASRFLALTAQRPGMVRFIRWDEITGVDWGDAHQDTNNATWLVPSDKIKQERKLREDQSFEHPVPLSRQAVETLRAVRYITGRSKYVFASTRSSHKPISENAIGYLYNREGYQGRHVPHGWRSSFSTTINEIAMHEARQDANALGDRLIIALMLAHTPIGMSASEMRYNRSRYMPRRRQLAQIWADMIMESALPASELIESVRRKDA